MSVTGAWTAGDPGTAPGWLRGSAWAAMGLALGLVALDVFVLRPGYGVGDETAQIRLLVALAQGRPMEWRWAQGGIQRAGLSLWLDLSGNGLRSLHVPGLLVLALEALLLWRLAARWFSAEAAAWAVLADLLCAATWMRARSVLSYHWLPMELLLLALLAGRVKGRWSALAWGASGALLLLDYEGALAALPGLLLACLWQEEGLRRRWIPALLGMAAVAAMLAGLQPRVFGDYVYFRRSVNWSGGGMTVPAALARNLGQLLVGGRPMPYLGVDAWPAMAAWSLPLVGLGLWSAWRMGHRGLVLWAVSAVFITQAATAPWGLPSQRMAAAWPALCLLAGAGGVEMRRLCPRVPAPAWMALLALGFAAEANAFYRHMAFHGREVYGRAELLDQAARDGRRAASNGAAVCTALMETRSNDVRFFVDPAEGTGPGPAEAWVFLPPEFHAAAPSAGQALVYRRSFNDVPVLVLRARGAQALRFEAMERDLRPLLDADSADADSAWLSKKPVADDWAYAAVLDRYLRRLWTGLPMDRNVVLLFAARPAVTPGPPSLMGRYLSSRDPAAAVAMLDLALRVDPWWGPALEDRVGALAAAGRPDASKAAAVLCAARLSQGAWRDYD